MANIHFYSLLLLISIIFGANCVENEERVGRGENNAQHRAVRARRHPKGGRRSGGGDEECLAGYRERIQQHCRYPGTEQPCFGQSLVFNSF